jgi:flagellin-like protein
MNKRGVSPLVATLVLIGFSIVLGAVVMSYSETYVEQQATFVAKPEVNSGACDVIDWQVITVKGVPQLCVRDQVIEVSLDNGPSSAIDAVQARVVGSDNVFLTPNVLKGQLKATSSLKTAFAFDAIGTPLQVRLTPVLTTENGQAFCSDKAIVIEDLRDC